jgi:DNA-binding protein HU-beta
VAAASVPMAADGERRPCPARRADGAGTGRAGEGPSGALFRATARFAGHGGNAEKPQIADFSGGFGRARPNPLLASRHTTPAGIRRFCMTKNEFVDKVASQSGLSKKDAGSAVDAVISSIEDALRSGQDVNFTGFGKFHVAERGAREGRNPRTGETMTIAASRVPRFTAGSGLKKAVK